MQQSKCFQVRTKAVIAHVEIIQILKWFLQARRGRGTPPTKMVLLGSNV